MLTDWERIGDLEGAFLERRPVDCPDRFVVIRDEWHEPEIPSDHNPDCLPERTVLEFSPVDGR